MKNSALMNLINSNLTNVRSDARIEFTQHGNGYCVCIRVPHTVERWQVTYTEWSLPATFMVWGIQTPEAIERKISKFLSYNSHLTV